ncbi:Predicted branched-chain amino acid permease (azaleucine resistance) [Acinetobacter marinus]|uniref:Predicted branched-chain amino acid permease (Azaleucine resistance) n=1 Tax=Acinetobacter marinus TaxID=281375 RepID=A0A1G6MI18_9GAMM|nr:AzlC family ABC transporter permease [Acinetobacter marinus]SDC55159.1 Predicted branched-chain amino acid permease (azaleucine resistance) [Acinetobacter marinus]
MSNHDLAQSSHSYTAPAVSTKISRRLIWLGFVQLLPISFFVVLFGCAFGLAAVQAQLSNPEIVAMSAFVFAGASQFAVLEMLQSSSIPIIPLIITVFFINARHILMGAALYPWLSPLNPVKRYSMLLVLTDANWAYAQQSFENKVSGYGLLIGGGIGLWLAWLIGTILGMYLGGIVAHPERWGLDMVMACFLLAMATGGKQDLRMMTIWAVVFCVSILAYLYLPKNMHVLVASCIGGVIGMLWKEKPTQDDTTQGDSTIQHDTTTQHSEAKD